MRSKFLLNELLWKCHRSIILFAAYEVNIIRQGHTSARSTPSFHTVNREFVSILSLSGRISVLEEEARQQRQALSKSESEKRQLQEKLTDLEKVKSWVPDIFITYHGLHLALIYLQTWGALGSFLYKTKDSDLRGIIVLRYKIQTGVIGTVACKILETGLLVSPFGQFTACKSFL